MPDYNIPARSENRQEAHTQEAVSLVRVLPGFLGYSFNPQALIKATNYLCELGRDAALQTLRKCCVLAAQNRMANPENALLVARILFVRKDGQEVLPRLPLGQPDLAEPVDSTILPLFPLYVHQGLPFLLITGYMAGGEALPPSEYIERCALKCDIRPEPLTPPDDPLASVDQFLESSLRKALDPSSARDGMLRVQALRAVSNLYPIGREDKVALLSAAASHETWRRYREAIASLHVKWNPQTNEYADLQGKRQRD